MDCQCSAPAAAISIVNAAAVAAVNAVDIASVNAAAIAVHCCCHCCLHMQGLVRLRARYGFLLVVDEAHATLVTGQHGGGAAEALGVADSIDVHTGELVSKASGAL